MANVVLKYDPCKPCHDDQSLVIWSYSQVQPEEMEALSYLSNASYIIPFKGDGAISEWTVRKWRLLIMNLELMCTVWAENVHHTFSCGKIDFCEPNFELVEIFFAILAQGWGSKYENFLLYLLVLNSSSLVSHICVEWTGSALVQVMACRLFGT